MYEGIVSKPNKSHQGIVQSNLRRVVSPKHEHAVRDKGPLKILIFSVFQPAGLCAQQSAALSLWNLSLEQMSNSQAQDLTSSTSMLGCYGLREYWCTAHKPACEDRS